jgi:DNA-binding response OmpR family regulator
VPAESASLGAAAAAALDVDMSDSLKFLVTDPLAGVQTFARQLLQSHGFAADSVLCCADPETALAQGRVFQPRFLITDWFPKAGLSGVQLYQRLRETQPTLQLALLSFDVTTEHELEAQALGAHFLLRKPFTADRFKAEMTRALDALTRLSSVMNANAGAAARPVLPLLAPQPVLKTGDRVRYEGTLHETLHVVYRQGSTVVQLKGRSGFIPVEKLQPA